jgi:hypothetical protein
VTRDLHLKLLLSLIVIALMGFAFGYAVGVRDAGRHAVAFIECDTDSDCLEKNGCGGYADPCGGEK